MDKTVRIHRSLCRHQCLRNDLTTEDSLPSNLWAGAAEQIFFKLFKIKRGEKIFHRA